MDGFATDGCVNKQAYQLKRLWWKLMKVKYHKFKKHAQKETCSQDWVLMGT